MNAEAYGQEQLTDFVTKRLVEKDEGLRAPMHKARALTFASLYDEGKKTVQEKAEAVKSDRQIFQRLITAHQAGRPVNLQRVLSHELMKVPLNIVEENGSLQTGNKALLVDVLSQDVACPPDIELPSNETSCVVIDGQVSVVALGKPRH